MRKYIDTARRYDVGMLKENIRKKGCHELILSTHLLVAVSNLQADRIRYGYKDEKR